jgi:hypothetical protein
MKDWQGNRESSPRISSRVVLVDFVGLGKDLAFLVTEMRKH